MSYNSHLKSFRKTLFVLAILSSAPQALFAATVVTHGDADVASALDASAVTCESCCDKCSSLPIGKTTCYKGCTKLFGDKCTCTK